MTDTARILMLLGLARPEAIAAADIGAICRLPSHQLEPLLCRLTERGRIVRASAKRRSYRLAEPRRPLERAPAPARWKRSAPQWMVR